MESDLKEFLKQFNQVAEFSQRVKNLYLPKRPMKKEDFPIPEWVVVGNERIKPSANYADNLQDEMYLDPMALYGIPLESSYYSGKLFKKLARISGRNFQEE